MFKKDPIFWWAGGIFIMAILLFAVTGNQFWLTLMIGSYLLRPTLASLGVARRYVDERQMSIQHRSGNLAFAVMLIACIGMAVKFNADGNPAWEMFNMVIIIGLAAKGLSGVIFVKNPREGSVKIILTAGLLITLFSAMDGGSFWGALKQSVPGLAIVGIGFLARKFPRTIGGVILAVTAALIVVILRKGFTIPQIGTALIVSVPLTVAGVCLFAKDRDAVDNEPKAA
jgi:hypothetical protein